MKNYQIPRWILSLVIYLTILSGFTAIHYITDVSNSIIAYTMCAIPTYVLLFYTIQMALGLVED